MTVEIKETIFKESNYLENFRLPYFNAAFWRTPKDENLLLARKLIRKGAKGEIDYSSIVLYNIDKEEERLIWQPGQEIEITNSEILKEKANSQMWLEDFRAFTADGELHLGGAIILEKNGFYHHFPAVAKTTDFYLEEKIPSLTILGEGKIGKNSTPITENMVMCRLDGIENNHFLHIYKEDNNKYELFQKLQFPKDIPFARDRIGTTFAPIPLGTFNGNDISLFIFHGFTKKNYESSEEEKIIYSIGFGLLNKSNKNGEYSINPCYEPLITPKDYKENEIKELHSQRQVVYCCGGYLTELNNEKVLRMFVNVGDTMTVIRNVKLSDILSSFTEN